jgi:hypothetical protein
VTPAFAASTGRERPLRARARARAAVAMAGLMAVSDASQAAGPAIEHKAVSCIVAGQFPRLDACFAPQEDLSRARVHFRADGTPHWYFVDMTAAGGCRSVLLPKPLPTTTAIDYYVSALGRTFDETRTSEYTPRVVAREGDCEDDLLVAGSAGSATVLLGAAAGAPAVPAGFSPQGIVAAPAPPGSAASPGGGGGGLGVVLALGAVGGGGYLLYKQLSDEDTPEDDPPPPPPAFDGEWSGTTSQNRPLTLAVSGGALTRFDTAVDLGTSPNARATPIQRTFSPGLALSGGAFTFTQGADPPLAVSGTLGPSGTAEGRIETGGRVIVTWRATRR